MDAATRQPGRSASGAPVRSRFFLLMSALMVAIIVMGFTPTFYLRRFLLPSELSGPHGPDLPAHLYAHGAFFTAWFLLVAVQPTLVALGRMQMHRRLGLLGIGIMAGAAIFTVVTLAMVDAPILDELPERGFDASLWSAGSFVALVTLGIWQRHTPAVHKRLMLMGSIPMLPFGLVRIVDFSAHYGLELPAGLGIWISLGMLAVIVGHDLVTQRRPHKGTVLGLVAMYGVVLPLIVLIMRSGAWTAFVRLFV